MQMVAFDTHGFVKKLTKAGMPEQQAEVLASEQSRLIENELATKQDIAEVKRDMKELEITLKRDIEASRAEAKQNIAEVKRDIEASRAEAKQDIAEVKRDIAESKADILKWMFGALLGQTAILGTLIKFL